ncbi:MAG: fatty acyl-AMP ligase [Myxococcota bacterium]|nr:fatty acyl-AMP ligase [Myxococcota bacterium]
MASNDSSPDAHNFLAEAPTLNAALRALVEQRPDAEALVLADRRGNERRVTLAELWKRSRAYQALLVERGLQPGQVVLLILPTGTELIEAYFGALLAGGVPALLSTPLRRVANPKIFTSRVGHVVANSIPHSIICEPDVAEIVQGASPSLLGDTGILLPEQLDLDCVAPEPYDPSPDEVATMQYSSGTTGTPKGVLVSHAAVMADLRGMASAFELTPNDVAVNWIPLFHDMGLFGAFLLPLLAGCRTVLIPTSEFMRDPACWLRTIDSHRGTFSWAPNLAYAICAKRVSDADLEGLDLSTWRMAINGSEPVLASTIDAFTQRMAPYGFAPEDMCPAWGLAEATVLGTVHPPGELPRCEVLDRESLARNDYAQPTAGEGVQCVSVGRPIPGCELEIRDRSGEALADRQVGDVWLRSTSMFIGYHRDDERTQHALVGGWLRTGDRGYLVDGYLYFVVREKDLIIIGGEKYVPDDIEAMINRVPGVRTGCAVAFGLLSEERGTDDIAAVVETRETDPKALEALRKAIRTEVIDTAGVGIRSLLLTPPDGVEKTTGGKLSRSGTRDRHIEALLESV